MGRTPDYSRFYMVSSAWDAAYSLIDSTGQIDENLSAAESRFLKRKACRGQPKEDCVNAFREAVAVAKAAIKFKRSKCPMLGPKPSRRYELLLELAIELEKSHPDADQSLIMSGCRLVELSWDR